MRTVTNKFRPDTCECVIDFSFDADLPNDQVESSYQLVAIQKCAGHDSLSDQDAYNTAWHVENKNKNKMEGILLQDTNLADDVLDDDGNVTGRAFKKGIKYDWNFDKDRQLKVAVKGVSLSLQDKVNFQSVADSSFGTGKIKIN